MQPNVVAAWDDEEQGNSILSKLSADVGHFSGTHRTSSENSAESTNHLGEKWSEGNYFFLGKRKISKLVGIEVVELGRNPAVSYTPSGGNPDAGSHFWRSRKYWFLRPLARILKKSRSFQDLWGIDLAEETARRNSLFVTRHPDWRTLIRVGVFKILEEINPNKIMSWKKRFSYWKKSMWFTRNLLPMVPMLSKRSLGLEMVGMMIFWLAPKRKWITIFCVRCLSFSSRGLTWIQHRLLHLLIPLVKFLMNVKKAFFERSGILGKFFWLFCKILFAAIKWKVQVRRTWPVTIKYPLSFEGLCGLIGIKAFEKTGDYFPSPFTNPTYSPPSISLERFCLMLFWNKKSTWTHLLHFLHLLIGTHFVFLRFSLHAVANFAQFWSR